MASSKLNKLLAGSWRCADGFPGLTIHIEEENGAHKVSVIDEDDGEIAEVYDIRVEEGRLCFGTHWPSNGRFIKYRVLVTKDGIADVTFTYSAQETWLKINA